MKKIALITGSNKGIGYEVLRQLGKADCDVVLACRNKQLGETAAIKLNREDNITPFFVQIDLNDPDTIEAAAKCIEEKFGRLDILVNNAATVVREEDGLPSTASIKAVKAAMETNFFGTLLVTQAMLPLLRKSNYASIVNVSSGLASLQLSSNFKLLPAEHRYLGYSASKAALNMLTAHLAYELESKGIAVNSADPGYTATDLNDNEGIQSVSEGAEEIVRLARLDKDECTGKFSNRFGFVPW